jgi:TRAP-type C4-dicarboxylate transport system substrate-binding protein
MFRKSLFTGLVLAAGMSFSFDAMAQTVLRYAEFGPNRGTRAEALNWMADQIKERSGGSLEIEFHWGKALLGTKAVMQGVGDGVADMGSVIGFFTPKELRAYNIGDLPVGNSDEWVGMRALHELATTSDAFKSEFANVNLHYVSNYTTGPIQLICTKEVATLADLQGTKLRGSGPYGKAFTDLGAEVQRMGQPDVYQALDSGLIECNQNYYYSMKAYKQYEVAGNVLELDWGQNMAFGIFMNADVYNGLTDEQKAVIDGVGADFVDHLAELMIVGKLADKTAMIAGIDGKAINVTRLSDDEQATLQRAGDKYVQAWVDEATADGLDGEGILEAYEGLIAKYADRLENKGYPWQ